ncbi:MAG: RNA-binding domain-containing protein [Bacteroidota bacterium]
MMSIKFFYKKSSKLGTRHKLLRDLVLLVFLLGMVLGALSLFLEVHSRDDQAQKLTNQAVQKSRQQFNAKIEPVKSMLKVISKWGEDREFDLAETSKLNAKFIPMLKETSGVTSLAIANKNGTEYLLLPKRKGWLTRTRNSDLEENKFLWQRWMSTNETIQSWNEELSQESEQKKWYQRYDSKNTSELTWSIPFNSTDKEKSVIIATTSFSSSDQQESLFVARADIRIHEILQGIENSKDSNGVFLISPEREILTSKPNRNNKQNRIQFLAATKWSEKEKRETGVFSVKALGETWWCGFIPLQKDNEAGWIAVTIPESDLLTDQENTFWIIAVWVIAVSTLGVVLSLILVRRYKGHFRKTSSGIIDRADTTEQIKSLITQGENPTLEFKSTVRANLKNGKTDKKIELSWLKTLTAFLNTQGGILLIGVDDSGQLLGLDADNFKNEDNCRLHLKNLIHQHVGPTVSRFIHFDIVFFHEKQLIVFECEPASKPVFLRNGQGEEFFIRSGPASVPLTISQTIEYLQYGPKNET